MEKKIANNFMVGLFVLIGFSAFVYVLFNIGGGKGVFAREFRLFGKFSHVKGLNAGSEVSLSGLRAGSVKKVHPPLKNEKNLIVEMSIAKEMQDRIRQDSIATIRTSGILGDKYIEISIGTEQLAPLKSNDFIQSDEPKDIFAKTGEVIEDISQKLHKGSDIDKLIINLNRLASNLNELSVDLKTSKGLWSEMVRGKSGENLNQSLQHLEGILGKISRGEGTLGALINDPTVYEDIKSLMGGAKRSAILKYFMKQYIETGREAEETKKK